MREGGREGGRDERKGRREGGRGEEGVSMGKGQRSCYQLLCGITHTGHKSCVHYTCNVSIVCGTI